MIKWHDKFYHVYDLMGEWNGGERKERELIGNWKGKVIRSRFIKWRSPPHRVGDGEGGRG